MLSSTRSSRSSVGKRFSDRRDLLHQHRQQRCQAPRTSSRRDGAWRARRRNPAAAAPRSPPPRHRASRAPRAAPAAAAHPSIANGSSGTAASTGLVAAEHHGAEMRGDPLALQCQGRGRARTSLADPCATPAARAGQSPPAAGGSADRRTSAAGSRVDAGTRRRRRARPQPWPAAAWRPPAAAAPGAASCPADAGPGRRGSAETIAR